MKTLTLFGVPHIAILCLSVTGYAVVPLQTPPAWESVDMTYSTGGAVGDANGDGWLDLFVGNGNDMDSEQDNVYYNQGGMLETTASWSSADYGYDGHISVGDVDNDGDVDMAVGWYGHFDPWVDDLYLNIGDSLESSPSWQPAISDSDNSFCCAFGDVDGDGDLDLAFAAGEMYTGRQQASKLYLNQGGLLDSVASWRSEVGLAYGVAWGDVDGDGDLDLALGRHDQPNQVYYNNNGVLDAIAGWNSSDLVGTNQIAWGDVDGDGDLDLAVSNTYSPSSCKVYYNTAGTLETTASWVSQDSKDYYSCVAWGDVDGDGDLDLAAGGWFEPVVVFENLGGTLTTTPAWSWSPPNPLELVCEEVVWGDIDNDGLIQVSGEVHAFTGERRVVYAEHRPVHSLTQVVFDGDTLAISQYCYDLEAGWVSLGVTMSDSSHTVLLDYTYSTDLELIVTNWHEARGNFLFLNTSTGVEEIQEARVQRQEARILQNYPNPFSQTTTIELKVKSEKSKVSLRVYDLGGRLVKTLVDGGQSVTGYQSPVALRWDGTDHSGSQLPSGVYILRLEAGSSITTRKLVLLR